MRARISSLAVTILLFAQPAGAQTPNDIESLIKNSKLVDTQRQLKAIIGGGEIQISTYCDSRAGDKDLKITSLLMMKEILQRYKTVRQLRVSFFDQQSASSYRTCVVSSAHSEMVDGGKPLDEVMVQIPMVSGSLPSGAAFSARTVRQGVLYTQRRELARSIVDLRQRGAGTESICSDFYRLEQACAAPRPNMLQCNTLYNALCVAVNNQRATAPRKKRQKRDHSAEAAQVADTIRRNYGSELGRLNPQLGEQGGLDSLIREIERDVRSK